mmetsp:Transcript_657/g.2010  ORF Transcript_657/g.2010 Transcript_657/m.2010 type:complete len:222 (+) Transcript_657:809-1474(+)
MMLLSMLSRRAGAVPQTLPSSSSGNSTPKASDIFFWLNSSANFWACTGLRKLTKQYPRLLPSTLGSQGRNNKSNCPLNFLLNNSINASLPIVAGTPFSISVVLSETPGSTVVSVVIGGEGGTMPPNGGYMIGGYPGIMKPPPPVMPPGVTPGVMVPAGAWPLPALPRFFWPLLSPNVFENGISSPLSSRNNGCHSRCSVNFSMNFSSRRFSMFCSLPWTRA